jgi:heme/copper-type cytochrome/quinol oxidase subunit 4
MINSMTFNVLKKKCIVFLPSLLLYTIPVLALAQPSTFSDLINLFIDIINEAIPIIIALAIVVFFWGLAKFIISTGGGKEKEDAKNIIFWGIIVLFILLSIWGIVRLLKDTFIP